VTRIRELTDGRGVAFAFDAVGSPVTLGQATRVVDYRGTVVMIGFPAPTATLELHLQPWFFAGASLRVSLGGDGIPARDLPLLAEWYRRGELDLDRLITRRVRQADAESSFVAMEAGETLRSVIEFQ
jgi:Zn-dependent alcohol dehydrogenase